MLLFHVKTIVKEARNFELAQLKKKKKERKHFGHLATFWFGTFTMSFCANKSLVGREHTQT